MSSKALPRRRKISLARAVPPVARRRLRFRATSAPRPRCGIGGAVPSASRPQALGTPRHRENGRPSASGLRFPTSFPYPPSQPRPEACHEGFSEEDIAPPRGPRRNGTRVRRTARRRGQPKKIVDLSSVRRLRNRLPPSKICKNQPLHLSAKPLHLFAEILPTETLLPSVTSRNFIETRTNRPLDSTGITLAVTLLTEAADLTKGFVAFRFWLLHHGGSGCAQARVPSNVCHRVSRPVPCGVQSLALFQSFWR